MVLLLIKITLRNRFTFFHQTGCLLSLPLAVCVFLYVLHTEDYYTHFSSKVRTFSVDEVIAAALYKSKGIHWDQVKVKAAGLGDWEM